MKNNKSKLLIQVLLYVCQSHLMTKHEDKAIYETCYVTWSTCVWYLFPWLLHSALSFLFCSAGWQCQGTGRTTELYEAEGQDAVTQDKWVTLMRMFSVWRHLRKTRLTSSDLIQMNIISWFHAFGKYHPLHLTVFQIIKI